VLGEGKKKTMGKRRASHLGENPFFKKKKKKKQSILLTCSLAPGYTCKPVEAVRGTSFRLLGKLLLEATLFHFPEIWSLKLIVGTRLPKTGIVLVPIASNALQHSFVGLLEGNRTEMVLCTHAVGCLLACCRVHVSGETYCWRETSREETDASFRRFVPTHMPA
jgi:hypothetical protein